MNFRLMTIFDTVCRCGSITGAADLLFMTQPAVSQAIKELEKNTGLILFDRLGKRLYLTECGKNYRDKVSVVLDMCRDLQESTETLGESSRLRIGCCITIACGWLPDILNHFTAASKTPVSVRVDIAKNILKMTEQNEIDLAFYEGPKPGSQVCAESFSSYRLIPVCSRQHPFAGKEIELPEFLSQALLLREPGSAVRDAIDSHLTLQGLTAAPIVESTNTQALLQMIRQDCGISLLPDIIVRPELQREVISTFTVRDCNLKIQNWLVYHAEKNVTAPMRHLLDIAITSKPGR